MNDSPNKVREQDSHPQTQTSNSATTGVFALLKAKPGVTRDQIMAIMPAEIRATVQLYLGGENRRMVCARRRQRRCFPPKHWRCRRGEFHHGVFAACEREHAGSRVHSSEPAHALTSANREPVSQGVTQRPPPPIQTRGTAGVGFQPTPRWSCVFASREKTNGFHFSVRGWIFATWSKQHAHFELHLNYTEGGGRNRARFRHSAISNRESKM